MARTLRLALVLAACSLLLAFATPTALRLALGNAYRVRTCVWYKAPQSPPASECQEAEVRPMR